ncbi:glycosyltransferase family 4 protein [Falsirhodobacter xinxiangensis]|uniref:glycosyltransferase family 4 protein n=1 Tax=Falsirhodobacter xinxiangensis TaxID=2530049 RepID=UPI0010A9C655|nr:glycosyltransferase family 4 protein [Rhodobacter xinxiangensis]
MTIGYVVKRYPRFSETFVVNEILAHEAAGAKLEIFALRSVEETHFQNIISRVRAPVTRIPDRIKGIDESWPQLAAAQTLPNAWQRLTEFPEASGRDVIQAVRLAVECRDRGVTHLHAHFGTVASTVARIAARLAGITWSMTLHAKDIFMDYAENRNLALKIADAGAVVTVSDFNRSYLADRFGRDVTRIYNGMDLAGFQWQAPREDATEIVAVGRLVEKKGFHILIEALRILQSEGCTPPTRIIGGGEMQAELAAQIEASGLDHVTLAGPMPQSDVIAAMRGAAMLACPCIVGDDGNRDGMPTVLLEAMALGCPVVATPVTGIPELVDGTTGLLAGEGDAASLAESIARLLKDPALRDRQSRAARARIEADYDVTHSAAALRDLFDGLRAMRGAA